MTLCDLTPETMPPLDRGTRIRIEEGAFTGHYGTVTECDGVMTAIEAFMFLGALRPTRLARRMVVVVPMEYLPMTLILLIIVIFVLFGGLGYGGYRSGYYGGTHQRRPRTDPACRGPVSALGGGYGWRVSE